MLTADQRTEFERNGIVKLAGVFSPDDASRMREVVWKELADRYDMRRDEPATWYSHQPTGLKTSKQHGAFGAILGKKLEEALDDLLGKGGWEPPKHHGQVLVTMPDSETWRVPHRQWHTDVAYDQPMSPLQGVKHWAFFDTVEPGGGGTVQLAGSHRLLSRYLEGLEKEQREYQRVRDGFLRSYPWLKQLCADDGAEDRNGRLMATEADLDGLPARVVELTGEPGDVYLTHLWVMHAKAPNAGTRPRMMRSRVFSRYAERDDTG